MNPQAHRGWWVSDHAVERFVDRVACGRVSWCEVAAWVRAHAHEATPTGLRTIRDQPIYRLRHPWPGPDAALIVSTDPDGTRAVVTCGWWEEAAAAE